MEEVEINAIAKKLFQKARDDAKKRLYDTSDRYLSLLRVNGCNPVLTIQPRECGAVKLDAIELFKQINRQTLKNQSDSIEKQAAQDFLNKFDNFAKAIEALQRYD